MSQGPILTFGSGGTSSSFLLRQLSSYLLWGSVWSGTKEQHLSLSCLHLLKQQLFSPFSPSPSELWTQGLRTGRFKLGVETAGCSSCLREYSSALCCEASMQHSGRKAFLNLAKINSVTGHTLPSHSLFKKSPCSIQIWEGVIFVSILSQARLHRLLSISSPELWLLTMLMPQNDNAIPLPSRPSRAVPYYTDKNLLTLKSSKKGKPGVMLKNVT